MKTNFLKVSCDLINLVANSNYYENARKISDSINLAIDMNRNANGLCPEIAIEAYIFNRGGNLCADLFFTNDASDETETICIPALDFQKWAVFNGCSIWYMQRPGFLDWEKTLAEEIGDDQVKQYFRDICMNRVGYKTAEFAIVDTQFTEFSAQIN